MSRLGCLRLCGPFTDGDGAVMVFSGRSAEEVEDWVKQDPFIKERYYGSYNIKEFTEANESNRWLMGEPEARMKPMGYTDEVSKELYSYLPPLTKKDDFDEFWETTIRQAKEVPLDPERTLIEYPARHVKVYDVSYCGMDKTRIYGWLIVPAFENKEKYPCLIHYHGFTGSRGKPSELMTKADGPATALHTRTADIDASKIVIEGGSQGGALGTAVSALDDRPVLAMVDVPSNSNLVCRIEGNHGAFAAVAEYLNRHPEQTDLVMDNLSYFDTMNMADRISCRMYFATYNRIQSDKDIVIYPFNGHEGGGAGQTEVKLQYLRKHYPEWFTE
ncbi:1 carbohydrate esterase [Mortierella sp. GBA39]|nr:1 carbohydrate esterase [Mortierella sp. GBA39]